MVEDDGHECARFGEGEADCIIEFAELKFAAGFFVAEDGFFRAGGGRLVYGGHVVCGWFEVVVVS